MNSFWGIGIEENELTSYIVMDNNIRLGKPCIKGTRITVGDILQWLSLGMTSQEIIDDFPELKEIHIRAALAFTAVPKHNDEMAV